MTAVTKNATYRVIPNLEGYATIEYDITGTAGNTLDVSGEFSTVKSAYFVGTATLVVCTFSTTTVTLGSGPSAETGVIIVRGSLLKK